MNKTFSLPSKDRLICIALYGGLATIAFAGIYGTCNNLASQALTHYSLYTQWELSIPLIPWMIYPYLSLNILFVFYIIVYIVVF